MQAYFNLPSGHRNSALLWSVGCLTSLGCFDADAMVEARRKIAIRARLEEVDLGEFVVTLPQAAPGARVAEIQFHAFGQVANRDLPLVKQSLEEHMAEMKHRLIVAARQLEMPEIEDPQLHLLRTRIATVVNAMIPGEPLQSVGFYRFAYSDF